MLLEILTSFMLDSVDVSVTRNLSKEVAVSELSQASECVQLDYSSSLLKQVKFHGMPATHTTVSYAGVPMSNSQNGVVDLSTLPSLGQAIVATGSPSKFATASDYNSLGGVEFVQDFANKKVVNLNYETQLSFKGSAELTDNLNNTCKYKIYTENEGFKGNLEGRVVNNNILGRNRVFRSCDGLFFRNYLSVGYLDWGFYFNHSSQELPGNLSYIQDSKQYDNNFIGIATYRTSKSVTRFNFSFFNEYYEDSYSNNLYRQPLLYCNHSRSFDITEHWNISEATDYRISYLHASGLDGFCYPIRNYLNQHVNASCDYGWIEAKVGISYLGSFDKGKRVNRLLPLVQLSFTEGDNKAVFLFKKTTVIPTFNDLYYNSYYYHGNVNLHPEDVYSLQIGWSLTKKRVDASINLFADCMTDRIYYRDYSMYNADQLRSHGVIANLSLDLGTVVNHLVKVSATYQTSSDSLNLPLVPKWLLNFSYQLSYKYWFLRCSGKYMSSRHTDIDSTSDFDFILQPFTVVNLGVGFSKNNISTVVSVNNVGNCEYQIYKDYPMPARTVSMNISYRL